MDNLMNLVEGLDEKQIIEYLKRLDDEKAIRQARTQPLRQALHVFKWILGYGGKQTMQHDKEVCELWTRIVRKTYRHFMIFEKDDIDPEMLGEMNLYAIGLIKEEELW